LCELHLQSLAWHFLKLGPKEGRVLTHRMSAVDKINLLRAVSKRWITDRAVANEVTVLTRTAERLNSRRNEIVHGLWGAHPSTPKQLELLYIRTDEQKILPHARHLTSDDVKQIASQIRDLDRRLLRLHRVVGAPIP